MQRVAQPAAQRVLLAHAANCSRRYEIRALMLSRQIGWTGDNSIANMHLLCRACNAAKSDGIRISVHREALIARLPRRDVPRMHFFRLIVWLVFDRKGRCDGRGCTQGELTMRLVRPGASLTRANLRLICYACLDAGVED